MLNKIGDGELHCKSNYEVGTLISFLSVVFSPSSGVMSSSCNMCLLGLDLVKATFNTFFVS